MRGDVSFALAFDRLMDSPVGAYYEGPALHSSFSRMERDLGGVRLYVRDGRAIDLERISKVCMEMGLNFWYWGPTRRKDSIAAYSRGSDAEAFVDEVQTEFGEHVASYISPAPEAYFERGSGEFLLEDEADLEFQILSRYNMLDEPNAAEPQLQRVRKKRT